MRMSARFALAGFGALLVALGSARAADPLPRVAAEKVGMSSARLGRIASELERDVAAGRLPGAVVAIARRGKLVYHEAIGFLDPATQVRMRKDAIFSIASMTKPMTGVATLLLQEDGRLHIAEPAARYLPALGRMRVAAANATGASPATEPQRTPMSIQDLMRHTAGMAYSFSGQSPLNKLWPNSASEFARELEGAQFLAKLETLPLLHQPATTWEYSVATDVLGLLVEAVAQKPLGQFLAERVFTPLGMVDTAFVVTPDKAGRYARGLTHDPESKQRIPGPDATKPHRFDCGGACAVSTAGDYLRFAQMLLERGRLGKTRVLGRKSVELMTADALGRQIENPVHASDPNRRGVSYGLTVSVRTDPGVSPDLGSIGNFGWGGAYGTQFLIDPREQLVMVLMAHLPLSQRLHYRQLVETLTLAAIED